MARQLRPDTRLARLILESGKPAYVVAGEVGINYNRLLDYADGRIAMAAGHRIKLTRYFGSDPWKDANKGGGSQGEFDRTTFDAVVRGARVTPGADAIVTLLVERMRGGVSEAWKLVDSAGLVLDVATEGYLNERRIEFSATVEDVRVKPGVGVDVRLRVPDRERDVALMLGWSDTPKQFEIAVRSGA
jgi:hypothetical protein